MSEERLDRIERLVEDQGEIQKEHSKMLIRIEGAILGDSEMGVDGFGVRLKDLEKDKKSNRLWRIAESIGLLALLSWLGLS